MSEYSASCIDMRADEPLISADSVFRETRGRWSRPRGAEAGGSGMGRTGCDAALGFGPDAPKGGADGRLPRGGDPVGPPLARESEVGAELPE